MLEQINKENFQHMLSQFNTNELEGMIEKFPYFQQAHLLLAKKYQQENSPKFDQQLQLAALYVQDRELLYELFNEKSSTAAPANQTPVVEKVKVEEEKEEIEPVIITAPEVTIADKIEVEEVPVAIQKIAEEIKEADTDLKRQIEQIEESARRLSQIIENTLEEPKEETETTRITAPEAVILDQVEVEETPVAAKKIAEEIKVDDTDLKHQIEQIEESARRLNQIIENTLEEPKEETETTRITAPEAVILDQVEVEEIAVSQQIIIEEIREDDADLKRQIGLIEESAKRLNQLIENAVEEKPEIQLSQPEVKEEQIETRLAQVNEETEEQITEEATLQEEPSLTAFSRIEPHTFDEWLKAFNNKSVPEIKENPVVSEDTETEEDELTELLTANISVDYLHELVKEETTYAKGLERFIEDQIQKHKQPEVKKSAPETDFNTDPATETMAKVYEMQKKYAKAIKTYEALTLKFPEKSSLFAARITYLKNIA